VPLANMRSLGRKHVFVVCGNPDRHRNAELDVSWLPDNVTFGDLQPRMLSAPSTIIAGPKSAVMAVPELTRSTGIQLNERVSLQRPIEILSSI
jgi:hypothetical protein